MTATRGFVAFAGRGGAAAVAAVIAQLIASQSRPRRMILRRNPGYAAEDQLVQIVVLGG